MAASLEPVSGDFGAGVLIATPPNPVGSPVRLLFIIPRDERQYKGRGPQ